MSPRPHVTARHLTARHVTVRPRLGCPQSGGGLLDPQRSDDELIGYTLINIWSLTTGRALRHGVPPAELGVDELIDFWADPLVEARK